MMISSSLDRTQQEHSKNTARTQKEHNKNTIRTIRTHGAFNQGNFRHSKDLLMETRPNHPSTIFYNGFHSPGTKASQPEMGLLPIIIAVRDASKKMV
jgi:hypothetical protein